MTAHVRWPAERFYWSVLEAPQWKRPGPLPEGLRAVLEEDLPVSAETLHAVGKPLGDGRLLVCAVESAEIEALGGDALTLGPDHAPEFAGAPVHADAINLLVG